MISVDKAPNETQTAHIIDHSSEAHAAVIEHHEQYDAIYSQGMWDGVRKASINYGDRIEVIERENRKLLWLAFGLSATLLGLSGYMVICMVPR